MQTVQLTIPTSSDRVFAVLADGWDFASWVVGASHIRDVDEGWPGIGTRIHHSVGVWPLLISDVSEVLGCEPDRRLELRVKAWPFGEGRVVLELRPAGDGTDVVMSEEITGGPGSLLPEALVGPLLRARNTESLRRLADIACNRQR